MNSSIYYQQIVWEVRWLKATINKYLQSVNLEAYASPYMWLLLLELKKAEGTCRTSKRKWCRRINTSYSIYRLSKTCSVSVYRTLLIDAIHSGPTINPWYFWVICQYRPRFAIVIWFWPISLISKAGPSITGNRQSIKIRIDFWITPPEERTNHPTSQLTSKTNHLSK